MAPTAKQRWVQRRTEARAARRLADFRAGLRATSDTERAVAAGLMEGEGTITIGRARRQDTGQMEWRMYVILASTDRDIIAFFQDRWAATSLRRRVATIRSKEAWYWTLGGWKCAAFLRDIEPFVVTARMRERIAVALAFQSRKRFGHRQTDEDRRLAEQSFEWMRALNHRGPPA